MRCNFALDANVGIGLLKACNRLFPRVRVIRFPRDEVKKSRDDFGAARFCNGRFVNKEHESQQQNG